MARIVVIEDEVHIQRLLKVILEKAGHAVTTFGSGEEGLAALQSAPVDLVILDILMPGIDGLQVLRSLKASTATRDIPVMMLTALAQENVVMQGIKLGAKDYIRKPFNPPELTQRVAKMLGGTPAP